MKWLTLLPLYFLCFTALVFAKEQWSLGVVAGATYKQDWQPILLPWISYKNDWLSVDPTKVQFIKPLSNGQLSAGLGLDYEVLVQHTQKALLADVGMLHYWGPLRFSDNLVGRTSQPRQSWKNDFSVGSQWPVANGMLGLETGLRYQSKQWEIDNESTSGFISTKLGAQYAYSMGPWQAVVIAQLLTPVQADDNNHVQQEYLFILTKAW